MKKSITVSKIVATAFPTDWNKIPQKVLIAKTQWGDLLHGVVDPNKKDKFFIIPPLKNKTPEKLKKNIDLWQAWMDWNAPKNSIHEYKVSKDIFGVSVCGVLDMLADGLVWEFKTYSSLNKLAIKKIKLQMFAYNWLIDGKENYGYLIWAHWNKDKVFQIKKIRIEYDNEIEDLFFKTIKEIIQKYE